jgi:RNA-directed DNA polymerase
LGVWFDTGLSRSAAKPQIGTARRNRRPATFNFLGFTFICGRTRRGSFLIKRKTRSDRMRAKFAEIKEELRRRMHHPIPEQGRWLAQIIGGFFAYYAVPTNYAALGDFRAQVI